MKFYKFVDPKGHHGLVYKEGLNVDPIPFNPSGDCEKGGIYFASEDILAFMDYGEDLYEVEPVGEVYENPTYLSSTKKFKAHSVNLKFIGKRSDVNTIKFLVEAGADIHACDDYALRYAARKGHLEIVKFLVEYGANIHALDNYALRYAILYMHLEVEEYLKSLN